MSSLLTRKDLKKIKIDPKLTTYEMILKLARTADEKLKQERRFHSLHVVAENSDQQVGDNIMEESSERKNSLTRKEKRRLRPPSPQIAPPTPASPVAFEKKISAMGGTDVHVIIEKQLSKTDIDKDQDRLLMPPKQLKKLDFVKDEELEVMLQKDERGKSKGIEVPLIRPDLEEGKIVLTRWDSKKGNYSSFVLRAFRKVVRVHKFQEKDVVQVWSFRVQQRLHLALVKLLRK